MTTQRRVLVASHGTDRAGGAETGLIELVERLHERGIEPVVVLPRGGELADEVEKVGVRWRVAPSARWTPFDLTTFDRRFWRPRLVLAIARQLPAWFALLRDERPDAVITNSAVSPVPALACRLRGVPHVWWVHEFVTLDHDLVYAFGESFSQRVIGWTAKRVVVVSDAVGQYFSPPIPARKIRVIYNGVAPLEVGPNRIDGDGLRLLLLGRQNEKKGSSLAIRAVARLDDTVPVTLRLTGAIRPAYLAELRELADGLGVTGRLEVCEHAAAPDEHLDWCNALLMCSHAEAFGRVTVEALKGGRPVIGSRSGGTLELITEGVDGLLFTPDDVDDLARAITRLASEPGLLQLMSDAALDLNRERYTIDDEIEQFVEVLDDVWK
jgi:glycosyltransferase involved in cell wall biosynthesis